MDQIQLNLQELMSEDDVTEHRLSGSLKTITDCLHLKIQATPGLLKMLDQLLIVTKKEKHIRIDWLNKFIKIVIDLIWATRTVAKINKRFMQVLVEVETRYPEVVSQCLLAQMNLMECHMKESSALYVWCTLIDMSAIARVLLENKMVPVIVAVERCLDQLLSVDLWTVFKQEHLHSLLKLALQICQYNQETLDSIIWSEAQDGESLTALTSVCHHLHYIVISQSLPRDSVLLAGTAISFLINCCPSKAKAACTFVSTWKGLGTEAFLSIGNIKTKPLAVSPGERTVLQFGHLSVINGTLCSASLDLLMQKVDHEDCSSLLVFLFHKACDLCYVTDIQYHAFKLLYQWFQRATKYMKHITQNGLQTLFNKDGHLAQRTLKVTWTHMDSPVDGVNESVLDIFKMLLSLEIQEKKLLEEAKSLILGEQNSSHLVITSDLALDLYPKVMSMSWKVKGKHTMLATLLQYCDITKILSDHTTLVEDMLQCLSTNYLAPTSTHLYKAILQQLALTPQGQALWVEHCRPSLVQALTSNNSLLRHNVGHNWLPCTLKMMPDTYALLLDSVHGYQASNRSEITLRLHAIISILKVARSQQLLKEWPTLMVEQALASEDDAVRLDTFTLLCVSPKTAESLSSTEISLLKSSLPHNMNMDSPPFRQQLSTNLRNGLIRTRDGALSVLRPASKYKPTEADSTGQILYIIDFVDWLYCLCISSLHPGSCYQRLKSALDWISVILDVFIYVEGGQDGKKRKKGACPETTQELVKLAQNQDKWAFFSPEKTQALLACSLDGTDEIRELAAHILLHFSPWPLQLNYQHQTAWFNGSVVAQCQTEDPVNPVAQLLVKALELCNDPRAREGESGALLIRMLFDKYVCGQKMAVKMTRSGGLFQISEQESSENTEDVCLLFLEQMISWVDEDVEKANANVLVAARTSPAHGLMLALQRCINEVRLPIESCDKWQALTQRLLTVTKSLINLVMDVFGGNVHGEETAPSFEQMSEGIQRVITEADSESVTMATRDETVLSAEHQLINTWCWLNIRESSVLLGRLGMSLSDKNSANMVLKGEDIENIADVFFKILTRCRHRGAIEGCNIGFLDLCTWLLNHSDHNLHQIPSKLLERVLSQVQGSSVASITRRSAGLPLIVQSIVASESKTKQTQLFARAVNTLMAVVAMPTAYDPDQKLDLPQVHAMNILKAVFRESSVAQAVMPHIPAATTYAILGFASPFWAVRNAATQLFGTLVSRMLGQKKNREDDLNTTTATEFFTLYPALQSFLLKNIEEATMYLPSSTEHAKNMEMKMATSEDGVNLGGGICQAQPQCQTPILGQRSGHLTLHPSLFPVLSILARLGPGIATEEAERLMSDFRSPVVHLASSPLYAVRDLAAQALVPLVPWQQAVTFTLDLIRGLPKCRSDVKSFNSLHGKLLQIHKLLIGVLHRPGTAADIMSLLVHHLSSFQWLVSSKNPCIMIKAKAIEIISLVTALPGCEWDSCLLDENMDQCHTTWTQDNKQPGYPLFLKHMVCWYLSNSKVTLVEKLSCCLSSGNQDVLMNCIGWAQDNIQKKRLQVDDMKAIQSVLLSHITLEDLPWNVLCESLQLLAEIYTTEGVFTLGTLRPASLWQWLMKLIHREPCSKLAALGLVLSAILAREKTDEILNENNVESWSELLVQSSCPEQAEPLRYHTANSLCIAGETILTNSKSNLDSLVPGRILTATVQLLLDEQGDVRAKAAEFVALLTTQPSDSKVLTSLHHNNAIQVLFDGSLMKCSKVSGSVYISWLYSLLYLTDNDIITQIGQEIDKSCTEMFASQETNPYWESVYVNTQVVHSLQGLGESDRDSLRNCVDPSYYGSVTQQLQNLQKCLDSAYKEKCLLNVTHSKSVYRSLHQLVSQAIVLLALDGGQQDLQEAFLRLCQAPWLQINLAMYGLNLMAAFPGVKKY